MNEGSLVEIRALLGDGAKRSGLLDRLPVGIVMLDARDRVVLVNRHAETLLEIVVPSSATEHPILSVAMGAASHDVEVQFCTFVPSREAWYSIWIGPVDGRRVLVVEDVTRDVWAERRASSLLNLASALSHATTRDEVIRVVVTRALRTLEGAAGSVLLLDEDDKALSIVGHFGYEQEGVGPFARVTLDVPIPVTDAVRSRTPVFLKNFDEFNLRYPEAARQVRSAYVARAALPLVVDDRPFGALAVSFLEPRAFDDLERTFLMSLAHQCALALARADLFDRARQIRALEVFARFTEVSAGLTDTDELAREATQLVCRSTGRDAAFVVRSGGAWRVVAHAGTSHDWSHHLTTALLESDLEGCECAVVHVGQREVGVLVVRRDAGEPRAALNDEVIPAVRHALTLAWQRSDALSEATAKTRTLEQLNHELDAFASMVSHDLQAPVRHLLGFTNLIGRTVEPSNTKAHQYLRHIEDAAHRMGTMITDLLEFSRAARQEMRFAPVDLGTVVRYALQDVQSDDRHDASIRIGDLGTVSGDENLLRQVFANLLGNAFKFSRNRTPAVIEVSSHVTKEEVIVSIRDNGVGFDPRYQEKLFQAFQRLHPSSEFQGTGIGLANVRRIVERHSGRVWATGAPGEGATFWVALPKGLSGRAR